VRITTAPGFDREALYELIYPATDSIVEGIAFASIRDFVLFLRYAERYSTGQPNPVHPATPFKAVLGIGVSQSRRVSKDMVYQGFNVDDSGHIVFDGLLNVVSGAGRTDMNNEFSQPGRVSRQHEDHSFPGDQFPFTYSVTRDPISGKTGGLLVKCTQSNSCPKIFHIDTNTEVWQRRTSLVLTDPTGKPVPVPENVRIFVLTGVAHNSNDLEESTAGTAERGICKELRNPLHYRYYERALFVILDKWVTEGIEPPASRYPNLKDATLISMTQAAKLWPSIPDVPFSPVINRLRLTDYSHQPPAESGPEYPILVARTNADGNPIGGIEPPEVTVPLGTYSGRNFRAEGFGEGDLCDLSGSFIPFAATNIDTCSGAAHTAFGYDKDETFYMAGRGVLGIGWINTRVWDETHDTEKSQGWCPAVVDTNGDGKIMKPWTSATEPVNPKLDRLATSHTGYIVSVNPLDGSVWYHTTDLIPGDIVRMELGKNPPETCMAEVYQPPFSAKDQTAFGPQGVDIDSNGIVWVSLPGSGHLASLDRRKCKVRNGPTATGQQCPEGWTLYQVPGPKFKGTDLGADYFYNDWVDRFNTLGLGKDVPIITGTGSDSSKAFIPETKQWVILRVPYPMGFYTRSLDGRIDDPKAGWKGRGLWSAVESRVVWHTEGGWGTRPYAVHFQLRPDPLAK
jgi:hypothetical protein